MLRIVTLILGFVSLSCLSPACAQVTQQDESLQEQLVPDSFKIEASAVASKFNWLWNTTISYTVTNNSGMNLYLGVMRGGVTIGSCTDAQEIRGIAAIPAQSARACFQRQPHAGAAARCLRAGRGARRRRDRRLQLPRAQSRLPDRAALDFAPGRKVAIVPDDDDLPALGRRANPSAAIAVAAGRREVPPVRDPYEILGVKRGASFEEIKAAYRRASEAHHPDMPGGSNEAMVELKTAYAFILNELKDGFQQQQKEEPKRQQSAGTGEGAWHDVGQDTSHDARRDAYWRNIYRDIDDELETLRRAAEQYDEQLRGMRRAAWRTGQHAAWAKLTWDDLFGFFTADGAQRPQRRGASLRRACRRRQRPRRSEFRQRADPARLRPWVRFLSRVEERQGRRIERRASLVRHYDHLAAAGAQRALPLSPGDDKRADPARADLQIRAGGRHGRTDDRRRARVLCHRRDRRRALRDNRQAS